MTKRNIQNWEQRLVDMLRDSLLEKAYAKIGDGDLSRYASEVADRKRDPYSVVEEIIGKIG
jgi:hypothetical protein